MIINIEKCRVKTQQLQLDVDDTGKLYQHAPAGGNSGPYWLSTTIVYIKKVRFGVHKKNDLNNNIMMIQFLPFWVLVFAACIKTLKKGAKMYLMKPRNESKRSLLICLGEDTAVKTANTEQFDFLCHLYFTVG